MKSTREGSLAPYRDSVWVACLISVSDKCLNPIFEIYKICVKQFKYYQIIYIYIRFTLMSK